MKYRCNICGYIHDEEATGILLKDLKECPVCGQTVDQFEEIIEDEERQDNPDSTPQETKETNLSYPQKFARTDSKNRHMDTIHQISITGKPASSSMGTKLKLPSWDNILLLGNQLNPPPLVYDAEVTTETIIGKNAKKPMIISQPIFISHMSYGALSKESKISMSKATAINKTAMCSGEGGILPEEKEAAHKYIFEYVPNKYSVTPNNLKTSDAIEIKIGQGTKPGMGGHLPGEKVTKEIAKIRGKKEGEEIQSPSTFSELKTKEDLKKLVDKLRKESEGRPIGIKIAAGRIEQDLEYIIYAKPDFITIDGRGGATGSSPLLLRDASTIPTIYALYRARKYLNEHKSDIDLIITGGLRVSSDFAKAIAMGADAIAIATAGLIATACQQYRICGTGECPIGIATQKKELIDRFDQNASTARLANYLQATQEELKTFAKITGHDNIHQLNIDDIVTDDEEIAKYTNIPHI
ncbi:MAG: glutamate synthase-related protein [Methanobacteriaceae archaeon]|nr:glutamate synthase-related protein [Methanobacteriaceae archaeon]